jgi:cbb3-type cytochrome oxidase subunit 3
MGKFFRTIESIRDYEHFSMIVLVILSLIFVAIVVWVLKGNKRLYSQHANMVLKEEDNLIDSPDKTI